MLHRMALYLAAIAAAPLLHAQTGSTPLGNGLKGEYFANTTLVGAPAFTRTDPFLAFVWGTTPGAGISSTTFSVRWTGQIQAPVTGAYSFAMYSDDGLRMWIDDALVIDAWTPHFFRLDRTATFNLTAGQKYNIKIEFFNSSSLGGAILLWALPGQPEMVVFSHYLYSSSTATEPPPAPAGLTATAGYGQVALNWTAAAGATSYRVYRASSSGGPFVARATALTGTVYTDASVTNNTTYYYRVSALNAIGESPQSNTASAKPVPPPPPAKPTGLSATAGNAQVGLSWTAVEAATSYRVYRSTASGGPFSLRVTALTAPTWLDTVVVNNTTYYYRVTALNAAGESLQSSTVSAKPKLPPVPSTPTGLTAAPGDRQITLAWNSSPNATSYNIYRATQSGQQGDTPFRTGITGVTFTDTGLTNGATYYYRVAGVNAGGIGGKSSQASASPASAPVLLTEVQKDAFRFLRQATWGPNAALVNRVATIGKEAFLEEQFNAPRSVYPQALIDMPNMELVSERFFQNGIEGQDQLRQRVAWALSQIFVVSATKVDNTHAMVPYIRMLHDRAFGNVLDLMRDVTLSPAMGEFLDMVNNKKASGGAMPNENYPRELMQLMSIGLVQLNPEGSAVNGPNGPIPTYTQDDVLELSRVLTGWTYGDAIAGDPTKINKKYYGGPMEPVAAFHDDGQKTVLGSVFPAGQSARADLEQALALLFNHPNTGPFLVRQLIQRLVTSNPSPAYIQSVASVFNDNGSGVRGDLRAVVKAILLHPEAAGTGSSQRKFAEPALFLLSLTRALNATVVDHPYMSDFSQDMSQRVWFAPSVFNYFSPNFRADGIFAPELQIWSTANAMTRTNFVASLVSGGFGDNLTFDRAPFNAVAGNPQSLVDTVDSIVMGGTMPHEMKQAVLTAVNATTSITERVRTALYLAAASMQYQVEH